MIRCYFCEKKIEDLNASEEHIIPNGIGGHLISKKILCNTHNKYLGRVVDAPFCESLQTLMGLFEIKKHRNSNKDYSVPMESSSGEKLLLKEKGIISKDPKVKISGTSFHIEAPTKDYGRKILKGIKKKFPHLDIESIMEEATDIPFDPNETVKMSLLHGGKEVELGVLKIIINYYIDNIGLDHKIRPLRDCLLRGDVFEDLYQVNCFSSDRPVTAEHRVTMVADRNSSLLFTYVELFNCISYLCIIDHNYDGQEICKSYCFDLLATKKVDEKFCYPKDRSELLGHITKKLDLDLLMERFRYMIALSFYFRTRKIKMASLLNKMEEAMEYSFNENIEFDTAFDKAFSAVEDELMEFLKGK